MDINHDEERESGPALQDGWGVSPVMSHWRMARQCWRRLAHRLSFQLVPKHSYPLRPISRVRNTHVRWTRTASAGRGGNFYQTRVTVAFFFKDTPSLLRKESLPINVVVICCLMPFLSVENEWALSVTVQQSLFIAFSHNSFQQISLKKAQKCYRNKNTLQVFQSKTDFILNILNQELRGW